VRRVWGEHGKEGLMNALRDGLMNGRMYGRVAECYEGRRDGRGLEGKRVSSCKCIIISTRPADGTLRTDKSTP
jgi:hypothetical protein